MNKNIVLFVLIIIMGLSLTSCTRDNNPVTNQVPKVGSIYVVSTPTAAQIWIDTTNTGKLTPDSIGNLSVGSHKVILKLSGFLNDTVLVDIQEGVQSPLNLTMVGDQSVTEYGPIQIWETALTDSTKPSGIILNLGTSSSIVSGNIALVDVYFSSNGYVIASAFDKNGRKTSFFVGLSDSLTDGVVSPIVIPASWVTQVEEIVPNYFFAF